MRPDIPAPIIMIFWGFEDDIAGRIEDGGEENNEEGENSAGKGVT